MITLARILFVVGLIVAASTLLWTRMAQEPISVGPRGTDLRTVSSYQLPGNFEEGDVNRITPEVDCQPNQDTDQKTIQLLRKQNLQRECKHLYLTSKTNFTTLKQLAGSGAFRPNLQNILVDDKHQALYCYIPKVACTNWKKMMIVLTGEAQTSLDQISRHKAHFGKELKQLIPSTFSREEILLRLKSYKKFLIVRHPLERLLSAYKNKFVAKTADAKTFQRIYAVGMMKYARSNASALKRGMDAPGDCDVPSSGEGMKFEEFLHFLTSRPSRQFQEHWASYFDLCHPCTIDYDFIGMYETLERDSNSILEMIGAPPNLKFPSYRPSKTSVELQSILEILPPDLIDALYKSYYADYTIFNYRKIPKKC